ncbi:hypothetical protein [Zavarzinia sp. CC-PAN008]|uniref:hypothetical protein n=1 Tax=Zavarzinia sp. CC-PAN008 TaxID=3243332 RepID=UPI003F744594
MTRWVGLSLDGWHDYAARDWDYGSSDRRRDDDGSRRIVHVDGGTAGVVIVEVDGNLVGGPRAALSSCGTGAGWGPAGDAHRRSTLRAMLRALNDGGDDAGKAAMGVHAAASALCRGGQRVMVAVPDQAGFDEAAQRRMLAALPRTTGLRGQLLWRSVALFHEMFARRLVPDDAPVRILVHCAEGFEQQELTLREAHGYDGHKAPVRDGHGTLIYPELGLDRLSERAEELAKALCPALADPGLNGSELPLRLLLGDAAPGELELLRLKSGGWVEVEAPRLDPVKVLPGMLAGPVFDSTKTVIVTPLAVEFWRPLRSILGVGRQALIARPRRIASGALRAARIVQHGKPHYLDRLEPIAIAVQAKGTTGWERLTPKDDRHVPANEEYVSRERRDFTLRKGQTDVSIPVLKGAAEVRVWQDKLSTAPDKDVNLIVQLRQTPGQSWARVSITSDDWDVLRRQPILLDWEGLAKDERTPEQVLADVQRPRPTVPNRIVEDAHIGFWDGSLVNPRLDRLVGADPDQLYRALSRPYALGHSPSARFVVRPVGSDGKLPDELRDPIRSAFLARLEELGAAIDADVRAGCTPSSNRSLLCVTWAATLCPAVVQEHLLAALHCDNHRHAHPLRGLKPSGLILRAIGRVVSGEARVRQALELLVDRPKANNDTLAALSHLLSRRSETAMALDARLADSIGSLLNKELAALVIDGKRYKIKFQHVLSSIGGLLRFREVDYDFLLIGKDRLADQIVENLQLAEADLKSLGKVSGRKARVTAAQATRKALVVADLIRWLEGEGDPNILTKIDAIEEQDDGDNSN